MAGQMIRRSSRNSYQPMRYGWPAAAGAVGSLVSKGFKKMKTSSTRNSGGQANSDHINTFQDSSDRLYARRRTNRRRVRKARKYRRSIMKVVNNALADRNFRRLLSFTTTTPVNAQNSVSFALNPCAGTLAGNDDLSVICTNLTGGLNPDGVTDRYMLRSSVLDITVTAATANTAVTFCDFYYVYCRKDVPDADGASIQDCWEIMMGKVGGASSTDVNNYGVTPFQTPGFCQYFLIQKVQRVSLTPGQTCSLMMKNNRLRYFNSEDVSKPLMARRGLTRGILLVYSGGPSVTGTPSSVALQINYSRTYCLNMIRDNAASYLTV